MVSQELGPPKPERRICAVALRASGAGQESCNQDRPIEWQFDAAVWVRRELGVGNFLLAFRLLKLSVFEDGEWGLRIDFGGRCLARILVFGGDRERN